MEQTLIYIVSLVVFALIVFALLGWLGVTIPPVAVRIFWILVGGIACVLVIRFLWPILTGGSLPHIGLLEQIKGLAPTVT